MYKWIPLTSSSDLTQLKMHISADYAPDHVAARLEQGISSAVKAILIELNYVDKDYRSTYYHFYSKKGLRYRANCVRLHFFDETVAFDVKSFRLSCSAGDLSDHYFGYMVLRPTGVSTIGRSVLSADVRKGARGRIITARHKVHVLGYRLAVEGFPSMDQHNDISVCAHVACWSILRHYSERYSAYREFLTYDITLMAQQFNPGGLVPSKGIEVSHAERILQEAGTFPYLVTRGSGSGQDPSFYQQLIAYVESGFPLFAAMHNKGHAIAIVGLEWRPPVTTTQPKKRYSWDEVKSLVVIDDTYLPYLPVSTMIGSPYHAKDIDAFIVALPEKVYFPADAVDRVAPTLFKLPPDLGLPQENESIIRYFLTTGAAFQRFMRERESEFDSKLLEVVLSLPLSQFVWIVEFATEAQWAIGQISARAVIDATASLREPMPLWLIHSRSQALFFDRESVGLDIQNGMRGLQLANTGDKAFTRMEQNLRPIKPK
jgi:hypothetical protein